MSLGLALCIAAVAVLCGQVVKAMTGFGSALVSVPVFTLLWGPAEAVAVNALCDLFGGLMLWSSARQAPPNLVFKLCLPLLLGQLIGTRLLVGLPIATIATAMGLVVASLGLMLIWRPSPPSRLERASAPPSALSTTLAGLFAGVLGGMIGASGPPLVLWGRHHFLPERLRPLLIAVFLFGSTSLSLLLAQSGALDLSVATRVLVLFPALFIGSRAGTWLGARASRETFGRISGAALLIAGLTLLIKALL